MGRIVPVTIIAGVKHKPCTICKKILAFELFAPDKRASTGRNSCCRVCKQKKYFHDVPSVKKEQIKLASQYYYENTKEKFAEHRKEYRKEYEQRKEYKEKRNKRLRDRRKTDPQFKIIGSLRSRVASALKSQNVRKNNSTIDLVGCKVPFLKEYLESFFEEGMTWENYCKDIETCWHIDHIRPCASFDLEDEDQQRQCFHYTNLQPMWASENILKSDNWFPEDQIYYGEVCCWKDEEKYRNLVVLLK